MSAAAKGKQYERELVRELSSYSLIAERVPRSVADAMPGPIDDVICVPEKTPMARRLDGDSARPVTDHLQSIAEQDAERFVEAVGSITQVEVKYTSSGAYGVQAHPFGDRRDWDAGVSRLAGRVSVGRGGGVCAFSGYAGSRDVDV